MDDSQTKEIVGFAGSLRTGSYNRALLETLVDVAPPSMAIETLEIRDIPMFDADLEEEGDPESVVELKRSLERADGLLIVTPEYNHGLPAPTKNTVDWASRPPERVLAETPVAIAGASPGMTGTARAQSALRQSLASVDAYVMQKPGVLVARAHEKFEDGELLDESTADFLGDFVESFERWVERFGGEGSA